MRDIFLICNAHLDLAWLWREEEGIAEAVSTFRVAADFCEEYEGFVFCHNEAILYEWVEALDPALFARIRALVAQGKWHIMGGWYLQPDCNLPSGEGIWRQIERGRRYFREKFGAAPTTAVNVDSFGHSRGLVQILRKNGYDSYLFGRPMEDWMALEREDFWWVGYDGSRVCAHRSYELYHALHGEAAKKIRNYAARPPQGPVGAVLWGIGNHGGGPSREDWADIEALAPALPDIRLRHGTPEAFFAALPKEDLPERREALRPIFVGCYTAQCRVKQQYRALENDLFSTEKLLSHAALTGALPYPAAQVAEAQDDLLVAQFHDTLPGSTIAPAEADALQRLAHGRETLRRLRDRAFFALAAREAPAEAGTIPLFVYNPHPYPLRATVSCEVQLADQNWDQTTVTEIQVWQAGRQLPSQLEKEDANLNLDWRKRVVFTAELAPCRLNRFTCVPVQRPKAPRAAAGSDVTGRGLAARFDPASGQLCGLTIGGREMLTGPIRLAVFETDEDPWNSNGLAFSRHLGDFRPDAPLRVIEDGAVRTVVEGVYRYGDSRAVVRYGLPKEGTEAELALDVDWREENCVLKWVIPSVSETDREYLGEDLFAQARLLQDGSEMVSLRWCGLPGGLAAVNAGIYGSSCQGGELALTLIESSVYAALTIEDRPIVTYDRQLPFIDQGRRRFTVWLGPMGEDAPRRADLHNQPPYALSFFPCGAGARQETLLRLGCEHVQLSAFYADGDGYTLRLYESAGRPAVCPLSLPALGLETTVSLAPWEIRTLRLRVQAGAAVLEEADPC